MTGGQQIWGAVCLGGNLCTWSSYCAYVGHFLLIADIYNVPASQIDELENMGCRRMRSDLWNYYKKLPNRSSISEVHDLTVGMLGHRKTPAMHHCGGAEVKGLLGFFVYMVGRFQHKVPQPQGEYLLKAGEAALKVQGEMYKYGRVMPPESIQIMFDQMLIFNISMQKAGGPIRNKNHMALHLIQKSAFLGNPRHRSTYRHESLNGTIAILARTVHRATFIRSVLSRFHLLQRYARHLVTGTCRNRGKTEEEF